LLPGVLLALLLLLPAAAQATPPVTFAEFGEGAGQIANPEGVAVDQASGDVYIADFKRVDKFDAEGHFLLAWGYGVANNTPEMQVCGPQANPPTKRCFGGLPSHEYELALSALSVAVDQSTGDVYVAEQSKRVSKFTADGEFILMFGKKVNKTDETNICTAADLEAGDNCGRGETGAGAGEFFASPTTVIVDSESRVWVGDGKRLVQFDASGAYISQAALSGEVEGGSFGRDSAGDFFATKLGKDEQQGVTFPGFADGDTYRLGNLPAGCSSSSTEPIGYPADFPGADNVLEALEGSCGGGNFLLNTQGFGTGVTISWKGKFTAQNLGQLTCEAVTGTGSCSVSTLKNGAPGTVSKLEPSGSPINTLTPLETVYTGAPLTLTLDSADNLYIGDAIAPYKFKIFNPAGEQVSQFGAGQVIGKPGEGRNAIAIGESAKALYSVSRPGDKEKFAQRFTLPDPGPLPGNEHVENLLPTTTTLVATLNAEGHATEYRFEYGTDESYGSSTPVEALPGSAYEDEAIEAAIDHLLPETTYHFRVVATNHCNNAEPAEECTVEGEDATFITPPAVRIDAQWASDVTARTASFHGELDPLGVAASWWLEYGTDESYGSETAEEGLGSGIGAVTVQTLVEGLKPGTTYHYRFAARDERDGVVYVVHGPDRTITTQVSGLGFDLADDRVWEMVSPSNKHGASLRSSGGMVQAADDGEGVVYLSLGSIEADPESNRSFERATVLARRGAEGWHSKDLTPPEEEALPLVGGDEGEFELFDADLSHALFQSHTYTPLSPDATERTPYLRENTEPATYTPLVTGKEGIANVPPGTQFGRGGNVASVRIAATSPDLDHVALKSSVALAAGVPQNSIYLWSEGQLQPLNILPADEGGGFVSTQTSIGSRGASLQHTVSDDGSRVFWSTGTYEAAGNGLSGLYLRDTQAGQTARLDKAQPGASDEGKASPVFLGANPDGTVAFFTDSHQLSEDASIAGRDLYRCEIPPGAIPPACATLTDISAPLPGSDESSEVLGISPAISEDGSRIYFVARGVLDETPNQYGDAAVGGEPNLYLWREGQGVRFIATLTSADHAAWGQGGGPPTAIASALDTAGSPNGRYLAFMSQRSLSGYDNREEGSNEPLQEVFLYDAQAEELRCVSCNPAGGRPEGVRPVEGGLADRRRLWWNGTVAAVLPQSPMRHESLLYQSRVVNNDGRVFFNAFDGLVPADSNGGWDVYQHEPQGVGDCSASSGDADTSPSAGGCVSLISSGTAEEEAGFLDASASGDDVFFFSTAKLSALDEDLELDLYDARVNGVPAKLPVINECLGEACQPAISPPNDPTPASAAFKGAGNLKEAPTASRCPKGKRKVRRKGQLRCVKQSNKRHPRRGRNHRRAPR
jgi:hypothetical protein